MDWPLTGAVAGVSALAALVAYVAYGAIVEVRSGPQPVKKVTPAPILWATRQPDIQVNIAPEPPPLGTSLGWDRLTPPDQPKPTYAAPARQKVPVETFAKPVRPPEPRRMTPTHGPVASKQATLGPSFESPKVDHRYDGVLTLAEIGRLKTNLRLTPGQEPHWPAVERVLRDIGKQQIAQVNSGRKAAVDSSSVERLYWAAQPLLAIMRPDQKEQVRKLARSLGYASYASMI